MICTLTILYLLCGSWFMLDLQKKDYNNSNIIFIHNMSQNFTPEQQARIKETVRRESTEIKSFTPTMTPQMYEILNQQATQPQTQKEKEELQALRTEYEKLSSETIIKIKDFQIGNGYISFTKTIAPPYYEYYICIDECKQAINELKSFKNDFINVLHQAYDVKHFKFFQSDKEYSFYPMQSYGKLYLNLNEEDWNILTGKNKQ